MDATPGRVGIQPGEGVVARVGDAVLVMASTDAQASFLSALLEVLDPVDLEAPEQTALAWRIAELLTSIATRRRTSPWRPAGARLLVMLHGRARALVEGAEAVRAHWSRRGDVGRTPLADPVARLALTLTETGEVTAHPRSDLERGSDPRRRDRADNRNRAPAAAREARHCEGSTATYSKAHSTNTFSNTYSNTASNTAPHTRLQHRLHRRCRYPRPTSGPIRR